MSGWPVLDVAIGLVFIYVLLSTICSSLTEGITTQLRSRSKYLERGIATLLRSNEKTDDEGTPAAKPDAKAPSDAKTAADPKEAFYAHPLIQTFTHEEGDSVFRKIGRKVMKSPPRADQRPSYLPGDKFAAVVLQLKDRVDAEGKALYPELRKTVEDVLGTIQNKDEAAQIKAVQLWYDQVMERVSGWYKRHTQVWVRMLAIVVAVGLNADTLRIANILWKDPTVRQEVVEKAKARAQQPPPETASIEYSDAEETLPDEVPDEIGKTGDSSDNYYGLTQDQWQTLQQLVGWDEDNATLTSRLQEAQAHNQQVKLAQEDAKKQGTEAPKTKGESELGVYFWWFGYLLKRHWAGWLLTVTALSLGAPFWYSLLNQLVNIRNAGKPPAKEKETAAGTEK
jgi:hypothetical protein